MGKKYNDKIVKSIFDKRFETTNVNWSIDPYKYDENATHHLANSFSTCYAHGFETSEINNLINKFVNETHEYSPKFNRLYLLKQLTYKLLNPSYSEATINFNHYFDWIGITNKMSEELLVEFLKGMSGNCTVSSYLMNAPHDFYSLNNILFDNNQYAKSEQHMHVNASSLNFNFSYYALAYLPTSYNLLISKIETYKPKEIEKCIIEENKLVMYKTVLLRHLFDILMNNEFFYKNDSWKPISDLFSSKKSIVNELFKCIYQFDIFNHQHIQIATLIMNESDILIDIDKYNFDTKEELYKFLDYERSFIRNIVNKYKSHDVYSNHVFMYMYYKNLCHSIFVSKNTRSTFYGFKSKEQNKKLFINGDAHLTKLYYRSIYWIYQNDNVNKLEWRITPNKDYTKHFNQITRISNYIQVDQEKHSENNIKIKPIIHFIKKDFESNCKHGSSHCFCSKVDEYMLMIEKYKREAHNTKILASEKSSINKSYKVIGIDAASDELKSPPEILGAAYRHMRTPNYFEEANYFAQPIRFTFHVGEVYANVLTGIRRIDEVIDYLQFQSGDRIGHGVALGINIENEYATKTSSYQKLGERLDDLVWLYDNLVDNHYEDATNILKLKQEIDIYISKINNALSEYYSGFTLDEYRKSLKLRSDLYTDNYINLDYKKLIQESYSQSDIFENYNIKLRGYSEAFQNKNARILYELYRTNSVFCDVYNESIQVKNSVNNLTDMVTFAQKMVRRKVARKDITVEVNISSNYFISSMTKYCEHPLFTFVPIDKSQQKDSLQVSINTDDSAIFQTSINREYSIIAKTLVSQGYSNIEVCEYIERLIQMSNRTSWIK